MKKIKNKINAATIGLGFGFLHAKVFKKNRNYKTELLNSFIYCIKNNKKNYNPNLNDIVSSMATCFAIDKSIKSKKWEKII